MGIGALGNTMNEWPLAALTAFALWWTARALIRAGGEGIPPRTLLVAGALVGLAAGAKLTSAPFAVGLCGAILARGPYTRDGLRARVCEASWFAVAAAAGIAIAYGPWAHELWKHFDSPIFPYGNQWFRSPWWEPRPIPGRPFGPQGVAQWLAFPFELASPPLYRVAEVAYRDARIPLAFAFALVGAFAWLLGRLSRDASPPRTPRVRAAWRLVALFAIFSFVVWTGMYSIYRYLLPLDLLTGVLIAGLLWMLCRPPFAAGAALFVSAVLLATTSFADWGRVSFGDRWFEVKVALPMIEPDALVLITTGEAVSYFIPFLPPTSRYVGALNTLVVPGQRSRLADTVRDIVRDHRGPLYQLTYPLTEGKEALAEHGLARTTACAVIVTNMPTSPLEVCLLVRLPETR